LLKREANVDLLVGSETKKLIPGVTMISNTNGSTIEQGLFMGVADNEGGRHVVLAQEKLEFVTMLVTPDRVNTLITKDGNGLVQMEGKHVEIAWQKLGQAMSLHSTVTVKKRSNTNGATG